MTAENTEWKPRDEKHAQEVARLEAAADAAKRRKEEQAKAREATDTAPKAGPLAGIVNGALHELLAGVKVMTPDEIDKLNRERDAEIKDQQRAERLASRAKWWEAICPARYREPFDFTKVAASVDRAEIQRVLDWRFSDRGLYLIGATGLSKTRAVATLLRRVYVDEGRSVKRMDGVQFANEAGAAFYSAPEAEKWLTGLTKPDVLWLDDLAKRWTPATEEAAFAVVERRTAEMRPLVITINYSREEMEAMTHDAEVVRPLLRRLRDYCDVVTFDGQKTAGEAQETGKLPF